MFKIGDCVVYKYTIVAPPIVIFPIRGYIEEIKLSWFGQKQFVVFWEDGFRETLDQVHLLLV